MAEVTPVPAASVILLRDAPFEVLMIRRHEKRTFAPDVWAFADWKTTMSVTGGGFC